MRGLEKLNAKLFQIGYKLRKEQHFTNGIRVKKFWLDGQDGSKIEFQNKNEALAYIERSGEKLVPLGIFTRY